MASDPLDTDVMASLPQVEPVLIEDGSPDTIDHFGAGRHEVYVLHAPEAASLKGYGPAVRVPDLQVLDAEVLHEREKDADIPPVPGLALAFDSGVRSVGALTECLGAIELLVANKQGDNLYSNCCSCFDRV